MQVPDGTVEHGGCQWAHTPETPRHGHATDREPHSLCSDRLDISFLGTALSSVFLIVSVVEMGIPAHTTPPHSQTPAVSLGCVLGQITLLGKSLCLSSGTKPAPTSPLDT